MGGQSSGPAVLKLCYSLDERCRGWVRPWGMEGKVPRQTRQPRLEARSFMAGKPQENNQMHHL